MERTNMWAKRAHSRDTRDSGDMKSEIFIAHSSSPKDHELTKLQPPNDFKIRNSDDLHVMILLPYFELIGKHCG